MLPLALPSVLLGGLQAGISAYQLANMEDRPNLSITPEQQNSFNRAEQRTGFGFSPEQRSDYFSNVAGRYSQGMRNASDLSGGQFSNALSRGFLASQLNDFSSFAAQDAEQQQRNIMYADRLGSDITQKRDMIANNDIMDWNKRQSAFGGGLMAGLNNITSAANFFAMNGGFNQPTAVNTTGQLTGNGFSHNGVYYGVGGLDNYGHYSINPPVRPSAPAGGWGAENQTAMNPPSDYTPDGLSIDQKATPFNNNDLQSPYGRYSPWGGVSSYYR